MVQTSNGESSGPVCEPRKRTVRRYPQCDKLATLSRPVPLADTSHCDGHVDSEHCLRQYFEFRAAHLEWWRATALAYCSPEGT